jgi:DeoR/GlpR family transcriptional regulator of sugar metabolism
MENRNRNIKSTLLKLFDKGLSEDEAHQELSKSCGKGKVSLKTVNTWFGIFKTGEHSLNGNIASIPKKKLTDESLIALIEENPGLSTYKLAELAGTSQYTISRRIRKLNSGSEIIAYKSKKDMKKFTDEFLIDLVNRNPHLSMEKLARLAGTSVSTIHNRINQINNNFERVNYVKKKYRPIEFNGSFSKLTEEDVINLINENSELNMSKLAELADVSQMTISRIIKQINLSGKSESYIVKDKLKFTDEFLINLVEEHSNLSMEKLSRLADTSPQTILNRINRINSDGEKVNYISKKSETKTKITNEFLIGLINENPDLNMRELAKLAGISQSTISKRLKQINSSGGGVTYINKKISKREI